MKYLDVEGKEIEVGDKVAFTNIAVGLYSDIKIATVVYINNPSGSAGKIEVEEESGKKYMLNYSKGRIVVIKKGEKEGQLSLI